MNAEQKAAATLGQLGAEVVWLGTSGVDSVYFTQVRITDADLEHLKSLGSLESLDISETNVTKEGVATPIMFYVLRWVSTIDSLFSTPKYIPTFYMC